MKKNAKYQLLRYSSIWYGKDECCCFVKDYMQKNGGGGGGGQKKRKKKKESNMVTIYNIAQVQTIC